MRHACGRVLGCLAGACRGRGANPGHVGTQVAEDGGAERPRPLVTEVEYGDPLKGCHDATSSSPHRRRRRQAPPLQVHWGLCAQTPNSLRALRRDSRCVGAGPVTARTLAGLPGRDCFGAISIAPRNDEGGIVVGAGPVTALAFAGLPRRDCFGAISIAPRNDRAATVYLHGWSCIGSASYIRSSASSASVSDTSDSMSRPSTPLASISL